VEVFTETAVPIRVISMLALILIQRELLTQELSVPVAVSPTVERMIPAQVSILVVRAVKILRVRPDIIALIPQETPTLEELV
jgi:hypothetical protein